MDIVLVTPPDEAEVLKLVSIADVKRNEIITHSYRDDHITDCIKRSYAFFDGRRGWLNRSILTQQWKLTIPNFSDCMEMPFAPLQSIIAIKYFDTDKVEQTLSADAYEVINNEMVGQVLLMPGYSWPATDTRRKAISIEYVAGFGLASEIQYPDKSNIQNAIIFLASHFLRNPSATYADPRTINVNRTIQYGLECLVGFLRVPMDHS